MKAQDARNARRPEKTFIATNSDTASRENRNPPATHAKTLVQARLDPKAHHGDRGEHAPPQAPRRLPRPELQRAFRFEPHPRGCRVAPR
jgi:hypothetical protein